MLPFPRKRWDPAASDDDDLIYNRFMETIAENRRARFDYEFKEKFDAGIELLGI